LRASNPLTRSRTSSQPRPCRRQFLLRRERSSAVSAVDCQRTVKERPAMKPWHAVITFDGQRGCSPGVRWSRPPYYLPCSCDLSQRAHWSHHDQRKNPLLASPRPARLWQTATMCAHVSWPIYAARQSRHFQVLDRLLIWVAVRAGLARESRLRALTKHHSGRRARPRTRSRRQRNVRWGWAYRTKFPK